MALESFFSIKEGKLFFNGDPITPAQLADARKIVDAHVMPKIDEHYALRALLFCIASERTQFERAVEFSQLLHESTLGELYDHEYLVDVAKKSGLPHSNKHPWEVDEEIPQEKLFAFETPAKQAASTDGRENRFAYSLDYLRPLGAEKVARELLKHPHKTRRELVNNVKWIAGKTASFWYLTLGGRDLLTMDVHNYRQLAGVMNVDKRFTEGDRRVSDLRKIPEQPTTIKGYEQMEAAALKSLKPCNEFYTNGKLDGALITGLFWTVGAMEFRGCHPAQGQLVKQELAFKSPYAPYRA